MRRDSTRFEQVVHLPVCVGQFVDMFDHSLRQGHLGQMSMGRRVLRRRQVADGGALDPTVATDLLKRVNLGASSARASRAAVNMWAGNR
jgi:hypothetical protein